MKPDDGGPAIPVPVQDGNVTGRDHEGLTIRDWFAGQALPEVMTDSAIQLVTPVLAAGMAYQYADAMIAERAHSSKGTS